MKALVIFSGGQDSTTCLYWAKNKYKDIEAITFNYGQKHSVELEQSQKICDLENIKQTIIDISFLDTIVKSALTSNGDVNELNEKGLPSSFVPNRNQLFITMSHSYAQKIGAGVIITGVCQTDYSGYPDCREAFIRAIEWSTNLGSDSDVKIETPLMYLTKAETFKLAEDNKCLPQVIDLSHTCYNGDREHRHEWGFGCDDCPACELRKLGYYEYKKGLNFSIIKNF
jgi:7-cyano-7-deazaguanine synthase